MYIPIEENSRLEVIKSMRNHVQNVKNKNLQFSQNGFMLVLTQTTKEMVNGITKTTDGKYIAKVMFEERHLYNNYYQGMRSSMESR